jgi:hypothetical protein
VIASVIAAGSVLGGRGVWSTAINEGRGHVYLHVADEQLPQAGFDAIATPRLLMTAISVFPADHRQVVRGYFHYFGLQYDEGQDSIRGTAPNGSTIVVDFDELGRVGNVGVQPKA